MNSLHHKSAERLVARAFFLAPIFAIAFGLLARIVITLMLLPTYQVEARNFGGLTWAMHLAAFLHVYVVPVILITVVTFFSVMTAIFTVRKQWKHVAVVATATAIGVMYEVHELGGLSVAPQNYVFIYLALWVMVEGSAFIAALNLYGATAHEGATPQPQGASQPRNEPASPIAPTLRVAPEGTHPRIPQKIEGVKDPESGWEVRVDSGEDWIALGNIKSRIRAARSNANRETDASKKAHQEAREAYYEYVLKTVQEYDDKNVVNFTDFPLLPQELTKQTNLNSIV